MQDSVDSDDVRTPVVEIILIFYARLITNNNNNISKSLKK